jgi:DNA adenine methylase
MAGSAVAVITPTPQGKLFYPDREESLHVRPFLKWAGGKTRLLPTLRVSLPPKAFKRYFEPFLGGAALFFDLAPNQAFLNDSNPDLINCYHIVRDRPDDLLAALKCFKMTEPEYYKIRALDPEKLSEVDRAARLIYLNKTCYNGLYRVNKQGQFNTPYGRYSNVTLLDPANLASASKLLRRASLSCADYRAVLAVAQKGDFVYLDPPYVPIGKFSDFKRYTKEQFYAADHERLAEEFYRLHATGCFVLLSNSYSKKTRQLFSGFVQRTVRMPRFVNCKGNGRGQIDELLISNYEPTNGQC